ncbi:ATP-grasp domain-containing protein [Paremcibacter congregatus]|uniref:ATP-grasp domain-containing protein n=1 Tax=Paremcibacter congregatus TaxID=2043170 RepID=UPI00195E9338|nr:ATP-grasp domain-containing protein [Paremcibacter congregatus]
MLDVRQNKTILVVEAQALGMIGVIRGLGMAGYRVIAASSDEQALGLKSNFATESHVCPAYGREQYFPWLDEVISKKQIAAIVPSESFLLAIHSSFSKYAHLMPGNMDKATVYKCLCKTDVFSSFIEAEDDGFLVRNTPKTYIVTDAASVPDEAQLTAMGLPIWIKLDEFYVQGENCERGVIRADCIEDATQAILNHLPKVQKILVQSHVKGVKTAVNLCLDRGKLLARSEFIATHENPHTGGFATLRHTWENEEMFKDALAKIRHLGWDGVAMMEYRWDRHTGEFNFIELNARYWGALHLELYAGKNFPQIQMDAFFDLDPEPRLKPEKFQSVRYALPGDFGYMMSKVRDRNVARTGRLMAFLGFLGLFLNPFIKSDLLFPGDRYLYGLQMKKFVRDLFR